MSTETLRKAAALMRERAEAATPGPWVYAYESVTVEVDGCTCGTQGGPWGHESGCGLELPHVEASAPDAEHIASWHPAVALAVADWLDAEADVDEVAREMGGRGHTEESQCVAVARAYLGSDA